jgi:hypothetical protein
MRFGIAQIRGLQYHEIIEFTQREGRVPNRMELDSLRSVYVFFNEEYLEIGENYAEKSKQLEKSKRLLQDLCEGKTRLTGISHILTTKSEFINRALFKFVGIKHQIPFPIMVVGHNLGFDLARLPTFNPGKALGDDFFGGFSLALGDGAKMTWKRRIVMKKIGIGKRRYKSYDPNDRNLQLHMFVDTVMLAKALLGADTSASMKSLCKMFGSPIRKEDAEHYQKLTAEYAEYCYKDVERSWFIYTKLRELYSRHGLDKPIDRIFSVASIGKGYENKLGIVPFLSKVKDSGDRAYKDKMYQVSGIAMEAMFGARAECGWRNEIREVMAPDFKSQYPTINILTGLQELLLAERIEIEEDELDGDTWIRGGKDVALLSAITIDDHLLSADKNIVKASWRALRGYALVDPSKGIWPKRTVHQDDDNEDNESTSINVGVNEVESGPYVWVSYLDVLASKFLTGRMPRLLKTKRLVPIGKQRLNAKINFFGDERYVIDLSLEDADFFRTIIEMRSEIKVERDRHAKGSPEYVRLDAMQLALKLIANSTSYGIHVQFDVDERETSIDMVIYYGEQSVEQRARRRTRGDDGKENVVGFKAEKPGTWFTPWGPLITAGGRLLIAIAECLGRREGKEYGGIHYGMCDTDSMAPVRPDGMPREEFRKAVGSITRKFQNINPYKPTLNKEGKLVDDEVFAIEDVNYEYDKSKPKGLKPLYILSISAKRYAMANIVKPDGSEYADVNEIYADRKNAVVILRKVSSHGLGHISAPSYEPSEKQPHLAVPYAKDESGELIPLYGDVCKGKGNPRLFLDIWKLAFEQFIVNYGKKSSREINFKINSVINKWKGLDQPQFKQRSINTWAAWEQYANLPKKNAETFFNVLPAPKNMNVHEPTYIDEMYSGQSLYCQAGSDIDVQKLLSEGRVWWQKDNTPAKEHVGKNKTFRLTEVREEIGDYFDHPEFKAKGDVGKLQRHRLVVFVKEYIGKESNFLLDEDLAEDDETQIEDISSQPYLRTSINPLLANAIRNIPDISTKTGVSSYELDKALKGVHTERSPKVLNYIRNGYRFYEDTRELRFEPKGRRKISPHERATEKLRSLIQRAYGRVVEDNPNVSDRNTHMAAFCEALGLASATDAADKIMNICVFLLRYEGVSHTVKTGKVAYQDKDFNIINIMTLDQFKTNIEHYLGITQRREKVQAFVKDERERRNDPSYVEMRKRRRKANKEIDRYENERIVGEVQAERFSDPQWDDIRIVTINPEAAPIFNGALRSPKRARSSLALTLKEELDHWDEHGYEKRRKARNGKKDTRDKPAGIG